MVSGITPVTVLIILTY